MARAPYVLGVTAAATAALVAFHPHSAAITTTVPTAGSTASSTTSTSTKGNKTFDGAVESNQYGNVQVRITVAGGKIVDVSAEQLPQGDPRSAQISSYAEPQLRQEALTAQSASINTVSGASYTSAGYQASLQSAIAKANL
ncbi:MAG: hypothetical protein QOF12_676 [Solirubrobacteraceae bacterium]|nr:hypothetical protein [Solirubrobacteraceae bacterium]